MVAQVAPSISHVELPPLELGNTALHWNRTAIMGVVNVTPDSFSDGGRFHGVDVAVAQGLALAAAGADVIDIGGESTRPGAEDVSAREELERVLPVIERLRAECPVPLSIDTVKAQVAAEACRAGAALVNDVSGLTLDRELAAATAEAGAALAVGHIRGTPRTMQQNISYSDVVSEVGDALEDSVSRATAAGVDFARILVDPGIGFGKDLEGNLALLRAGHTLRDRLGRPVLVGPSRKSFIGRITGADVTRRLPGTVAACVAAAIFGADMVRVHDVIEVRQAVQVTDALLGRPGQKGS